MKIALIGYGKMGREIESIALSRNHEIVLKIDKDNLTDLTAHNLKNVDVAFEFSTPQTAFRNITTCIENSTPVVCGTTGWLEKMEEIKDLLAGKGTSLFYAPNFSLGVNLFFRINKTLTHYLNRTGNYSPRITEIHHTQKLDAPSGTAISIANIIIKELEGFNGWSLLPEQVIDKVPIEAVREGDIPGTHIVTFDSPQDEIILTHRAKNRKGFALGAVLAGEFIIGKKGLFSMDDLLNL